MNKNVIVVGGFIEIIELLNEMNYSIQGIIDNNYDGHFMNYPILGTDEDAVRIMNKLDYHGQFVVTPDQPKTREKLHLLYSEFGLPFLKLISNSAIISKSSCIHEGSIIQAGVNVSSECHIGKLVKLNTYCNLMHNSRVGDYSTIAPNAVILGFVSIGERCYVGANATILPNVSISDDIIIGAGSVVTKDLFIPGTYLGCPARQYLK